MSALHTPGPWAAGQEFRPARNFGLQNVISIAVSGEVVAHVNCGFGRGEENARLIAAAPELLNALSRLTSFAAADLGPADHVFVAMAQECSRRRMTSKEFQQQLVIDARAAIAKAVQS